MANNREINLAGQRKGVTDMQAQTSLRMTIVRSRIEEWQADAAQSRLATLARAANRTPSLRRRLGRRLVAVGAAIARDGLVEGTGEPIARVTDAARTLNPYTDPCIDIRSGLGRAL
jgi:hypothetical protein